MAMLHRHAIRDLHLGTSTARDVIRHVERKLRPEVRRTREHREIRHGLYRDVLREWEESASMYRAVMGGTL